MHTQAFRLVLRCHPRFLLLKPSCVMIASHFVGQISIIVNFCCTHIKPSCFANRKLERNNSIGWSRFIFFWDQPLFLVVKGRRFAACNWNGARRHRRHGPAGCSGHVSDLANINVAGKFGWNGAFNGKLIYVLIYKWGITRCHVWLLQCKFKYIYIYIIIYS